MAEALREIRTRIVGVLEMLNGRDVTVTAEPRGVIISRLIHGSPDASGLLVYHCRPTLIYFNILATQHCAAIYLRE